MSDSELRTIAEANPQIAIDLESFAELTGRDDANTKITYIYRDASNYKTSSAVILTGTLAPADLQTILNHLDEEGGFIPGQVGLPDLQHLNGAGWDEETDHPFHDITQITLTSEPGTQDLPSLIREFTEVSWDQDYRPELPAAGNKTFEVTCRATATIEEIWTISARDEDHAREIFEDPDAEKTHVSDRVVGDEEDREITAVELAPIPVIAPVVSHESLLTRIERLAGAVDELTSAEDRLAKIRAVIAERNPDTTL